MKLLIDENVSHRIVERLLSDGHTVIFAQDVAPGKRDEEVLRVANSLDAIVLTEDSDFGELVVRQRLPAVGVIRLRLEGMPRALQPDYAAQTIATHAATIAGTITVITRSAVRSRPLSWHLSLPARGR